MDNKTKEVMMRIGKSIPRELLAKGIIREKPFQFEKDIIEERSKSKSVPFKEREMLRKALESDKLQNTYNRETTSMNHEVSKEIEKFVETKMKREIASGRLKPADKNDPFMRFIDSRMKR